MSKRQKREVTKTQEAMLRRADMNFSLARTCESAVKKCLSELGLGVGSAAIPPVGNTGKWTICMAVESSNGAHVCITFNGSVDLATSKSTVES
jgi:hypothetical protein